MTSMYTVCPKCALTLAVTAGDLRVAQGHVRCGRCQHVFNALTRLTSEDRQGGMADPEATAVQAGLGADPLEDEPFAEDAFEFNAEDASKVFVEALPAPKWTPTGTYRGTGLRDDARAPSDDTVEMQPIQADLGDGTLETPILTAPAEPPPRRVPPRTSPPAPPPRRPPAMAPETAEEDPEPVPISSEVWTPRRSRITDPDLPLAALLQTDRTPAQEGPAPAPLSPMRADPQAMRADPQAMRADPQAAVHAILRPAPKPGRVLWATGSVVLALVLAAQLIHHARSDLAVMYPQLRGPLTRLYAALGIPLVPRWDLTAYDVRQLGAEASPAHRGQIMVSASIALKRTAHQAQPLPLLRVIVQDRLGNPTGALDVPPRAYLPATRRSNAFLAAGERIDTTIAFRDPGDSAENFEIDACLPAPGGGTACASDAARR